MLHHSLMYGLGATYGLSFLQACKAKGVIDPVLPEISASDLFFKISLAEWSLNRSIFDGKMDHLDFADKAKSFDIHAIEYVNQFFKDKAEDRKYLSAMNKRANDAGVVQLLIMIDGEGGLAQPDKTTRSKSIENHYKWVDAAAFLGCHSIRVNAFGEGQRDAVSGAAIDGLGRLSEFAAKSNINIIVENHGGYSSDGAWLADVMTQIDLSNCGTLPDFGNFCIEREDGAQWGKPCVLEYDRYKGVDELMPFAKAVSAKSHKFEKSGEEQSTDYKKMLSMVKKHNYSGYIGIEYEGDGLSEDEGIIATKALLVRSGLAIE